MNQLSERNRRTKKRNKEKSERKEKEKPKIVYRNDKLQHFHVSGTFGGLNPMEGRLLFYLDTGVPTTDEKGGLRIKQVDREVIVDARMPVLTFIQTAKWMNDTVKKLEESGILKVEEIKKGVNIPIGEDNFYT